MHFVNDCVAAPQLLPHVLLVDSALCEATAGAGAAASGAEEPPPKGPPTALLRVWPMADPTATPLFFFTC